MYAGVILFNALYVNTALLNLSLLSNDNHPSSLNIPADGVRKSVLELFSQLASVILGVFQDLKETSSLKQQSHNPLKALCNFGKTVFELLPVHIQIVALIMIF